MDNEIKTEKVKKDWTKDYVSDLQEWTEWDKQYDEKVTMLFIALEKFIKSTTFNRKGKKVPLTETVENGKKIKWKGCDGYLVDLTEEEKLMWEKYRRLSDMLNNIIRYDARFDCKHFGVKDKMLYNVKCDLQHISTSEELRESDN